MEKQRFYVNTEGNDDQAYLEAIAHACKLTKDNVLLNSIVLLVHTKDNTAWFDRSLGEVRTKELVKGFYFSEFNTTLKIESLKTFRGADVVIACALHDKELLDLDGDYSVKVIIAIPWQKTGVVKWLGTWKPKDLRGSSSSIGFAEPTCIVKEALRILTHSINLSTGIHHRSDEHLAKTFIRALRKYEPELNPDVVGAYLVRELGWNPAHARDVEKLITTLNNGRYFQGGDRTGLKAHYKKWKDACK